MKRNRQNIIEMCLREEFRLSHIRIIPAPCVIVYRYWLFNETGNCGKRTVGSIDHAVLLSVTTYFLFGMRVFNYIIFRDAPDTVFTGYPAGRISG
jgi:hypothetical protein